MNPKRAVKTSKFLSLVLRHRPGVIGIELDENGYVDVGDMLRKMAAHNRPLTRDELQHVVDTNNKQRFAFNEDGTRIRASQGHSVDVDLALEPREPPLALYHGTADRFVASIIEKGLEPRSRRHVHLSSDFETARTVGSRHGRPTVFEVYALEMKRAGFEFYLSENGVWLTRHVPPNFLYELPKE